MAGKEATIYIVDVGATTAECHSGRLESDLDFGMRYVWDKITEIMASERKSFTVGIVGFRTDETLNEQYDQADTYDDKESYKNISVFKKLEQMTMSDLQPLQQKIQASNNSEGDAISAVVVAIPLMEKHTMLKSGKPGKYKRKIVLLTDGQGNISDDEVGPIAQKLNELEIEIAIIGIDFDDDDYGFKEEDKDDNKRRNENILKELADGCTESLFATAAEAIESLAKPKVKATKPYITYEGPLKLGNDAEYPETAMVIDVKRYFRTKLAKAPSARSMAITKTDALGSSLEDVKTSYSYEVNDPEAPGGKRSLQREELDKGYLYGSTVVHINESELNETVLETTQSFEIIGFIPNDNYDRFLTMGESCITIAQPTNEKAVMALSSLIHALHELGSYAVARFVPKENKPPQLLLLAPCIEPDMEALVDIPLPFAEDVRLYRFAPLDRLFTTSGTILKSHKYLLPSEELTKAMGDYMDSMDLSELGTDDDGNPTEYMMIDDLYNPHIHRLNQAIRRKAISNETVGEPAEILVRYREPPQTLKDQTKSNLATLKRVANVQKVPDKVVGVGKSKRRKQATPLSNLNINELVAAGSEPAKRTKIDPANVIPDFKYMLENPPVTEEAEHAFFTTTCKQLGAIIRSTLETSFKLPIVGGGPREKGLDRASEFLSIMRAGMSGLETPTIYNDYILGLKKWLLADVENVDGKQFFLDYIKRKKLGLISAEEIDMRTFLEVSAAKAEDFYRLTLELPDRTVKAEEDS
ncbi:ATP-dependent DNA helicase-like protein II subunit 2 [Calycina marina]|uniref:ATP-dependent DNA helicase II subunit 2 n=1 Tax=Calycina marina TaxID=1763456 RepID=A0A9P7YYA1_9HELO|nr:ATP-dependent DNA helicase-like protein II subunit 2 [Calycina marina]